MMLLPPSCTKSGLRLVTVFSLIIGATSGCIDNPSRAQEVTMSKVDTPPSVSLVVSAEATGRTPGVIGYNMGDNFPGSNVSSWLRYSEMNGARYWFPQDAWPVPPASWDTVGTLAKFEEERARLRSHPQAAIDWKAYGAGHARISNGVPPSTIGSNFSLSELRRMGVNVLVTVSRPTGKHRFDIADNAPDWFGRWTYWRGVYINAFYLAQYYDVQRFQLFNEPDHHANRHIEQGDYLRRLQLGSDAVQAAVTDVNRFYNKSLRAQISAPVTAGMIVFGPRKGREDTRDLITGWGEMAMRHRKDDFPGRSVGSQETFQAYAFQHYGRTPSHISNGLPRLRALVTKANGGMSLPLVVSEMNVSTAGDFAKKPETLDTPQYYAAFGAIAAAYTNAGINEVYVFRLTQNINLDNGTIKKNGTHFLNQADPLKNILGTTKGAEAVRLFMRGFKGARMRLAEPIVSGVDLHTVAARDEATAAYTLMVTNLGPDRVVNIDLSAWKLPAQTFLTVDEVSESHHGDVSHTLALPTTGRFSLPMESCSIALLTVWPDISGRPRVEVPLEAANGILRGQTTLIAGGRALLVVRAVSNKAPLRVRVYNSADDSAQTDLLGQITLEGKSTEATVDVTRAVTAAAGKAPAFRLVPNDARLDATAFTVGAAQLRVFGAPEEK